MALKQLRSQRAHSRAFGSAKAPRPVVRAHASLERQSSRRDVMMVAGGAIVAPLVLTGAASADGYKLLPVDSLSTFQRRDQVTEYARRINATLGQYLDASDAPACVRLVLHDAATYDAVTKTGGLDGSIVLNAAEAGRPENASLKAVVTKLRAAKKEIDENDKAGAGPISWADLIVVAGKVAMNKKFFAERSASTGALVATNFATEFPVRLGRLDADVEGPNRIPAANASPEEIRAFLLRVGETKPSRGIFDGKPLLWEKPGWLLWTSAAEDPAAEEERFNSIPEFRDVQTVINRSRETNTRTDYEVSFVEAYNRLADLGAKFNKDAYLYPIKVANIRL